MRKILMSLGMVVFAGSIVVGATGAFFSDTETSSGNTFAAGAIDLQIDNTSYITSSSTGQIISWPATSWQLSDLTGQLFFDFIDLKPGDMGEDTISIHVGDNDAWACMAIKTTLMPENGVLETEVGDGTSNDGELQNYLNFAFWHDDGDNVFEVGENVITSLSGVAGTVFNGAWQAIADSVTGSPLPGGTSSHVGKAWCFGTLTPNPQVPGDLDPLINTGFTCDGTGDQNDAQTDGIVADVSFYAEQARNNDSFLCSDLNQPD